MVVDVNTALSRESLIVVYPPEPLWNAGVLGFGIGGRVVKSADTALSFAN